MAEDQDRRFVGWEKCHECGAKAKRFAYAVGEDTIECTENDKHNYRASRTESRPS